jgi:hypothetical protein
MDGYRWLPEFGRLLEPDGSLGLMLIVSSSNSRTSSNRLSVICHAWDNGKASLDGFYETYQPRRTGE